MGFLPLLLEISCQGKTGKPIYQKHSALPDEQEEELCLLLREDSFSPHLQRKD
jgi:hypothetical protein